MSCSEMTLKNIDFSCFCFNCYKRGNKCTCEKLDIAKEMIKELKPVIQKSEYKYIKITI